MDVGLFVVVSQMSNVAPGISERVAMQLTGHNTPPLRHQLHSAAWLPRRLSSSSRRYSPNLTGGGYNVRDEAKDAVTFFASNGVLTGRLKEMHDGLSMKLRLE